MPTIKPKLNQFIASLLAFLTLRYGSENNMEIE